MRRRKYVRMTLPLYKTSIMPLWGGDVCGGEKGVHVAVCRYVGLRSSICLSVCLPTCIYVCLHACMFACMYACKFPLGTIRKKNLKIYQLQKC